MDDRILNRLIIISIVLAAVQAAIFAFFAYTWWDEAGYLYKGWLIFEHNWMPYKDMAFRFPPVFYYVYGFPQYLFGPSFLLGRIESVFFLGLMLFVLYKLAVKLGGKLAGAIALLLIASHPFLIQHYSAVFPYSISVLFILSSIFVLTAGIKNPWRIILSVSLMSLAVLTRNNLAPALIILLLYILFFEENKRNFLWASATAILVNVFILFPFLRESYDIVVDVLLNKSYFQNLYFNESLYQRLVVVGQVLKKTLIFLIPFLGLILFSIWGKKWSAIKSMIYRNKILFLTAVVFASIFFFHTFYIKFRILVEYSLYSLPLVAVFISVGLSKILNYFNQDFVAKKIIISFVLASAALGLVTTNVSNVISNPLRPYDSDINRIKRGAEIIKNNTNPDDKIFHLGHPHQVFAAERVMFSPLIGSIFRFTSSKDTELAEKYHFYNKEMITSWISKEADVVILQKGGWEYLIRRGKWPEGDLIINIIKKELDENYTLIESAKDVYPYKMKFREGVMEIYRRN